MSITLDRLLLSLDRLRELVGHEALISAASQQLRTPLGRESLSEPQRSRVLGRRFPMGARPSSPLRRTRRPAQHPLNIPRRLGMIRETREIQIVCPARFKRCDRGTMQRQPTVGSKRLVDRQPRQLVPESNMRAARGEYA